MATPTVLATPLHPSASADSAASPDSAPARGRLPRRPERVVIIGGGITGCILAERLRERWPGAAVQLLEGSAALGGLSVASQPDDIGWDRFYHVVTPQDVRLIGWLQRLGLKDRLRWKAARTGFYTDGRLHPFNTPLDFLRFSPLSLPQKVRLAATILYASRVSDGAPLEKLTAEAWLRKLSGDGVYDKIWGPLLRAKLGSAHREAAASFIWSTIRRLYATREGEGKTEAFGYISGGYAPVFQVAQASLEKLGVQVRLGTKVVALERGAEPGVLRVRTADGGEILADRVIFTGPSRALPKLCSGLEVPGRLLDRAASQRYLGVICMVVKLRRAISPYYVLNLTDPGLPFTGVIGLTTLVDPQEVGGYHLVYLPRYLPDDDPDFAKPDEVFYAPFMAALQKIFWRRGFCPDEVVLWRVFRTRFVSPLHGLGYDQLRLPIPILPGQLYLLNTGRVLGGTLNNNQMIEEAELERQTV